MVFPNAKFDECSCLGGLIVRNTEVNSLRKTGMYVQLQYRLLWQQTAAADNSCNAAFLITASVHTLTKMTLADRHH